MTVRAPYAGLIIERNVRAGDLGAATTPWFRMAKDGQIELAADVSEDALDKLRIGAPAEVTLADGAQVPGVGAPGQPGVERPDQARPRAHPAAGAAGHPRRRLRRAVFTGASRSTLAVPETAVRYDADGAVGDGRSAPTTRSAAFRSPPASAAAAGSS